jgi:cytochrome oxidase Cu insertion factor (SCO1/SenC/PrrC family)
MRKLISGIVIGIIILFSLVMGSGVAKKVEANRQLAEKISYLPSFTFTDLENKTFSSSELKTGPILIMHFHPECEHCQYEISEILKESVLKKLQSVILVSALPPDSIRRFLNTYNYKDYSNVIPLSDTSDNFGDIFGTAVIPSNYIYGRDLRLKKVFYGEVKTDAILKYLQGID